MAARARGGGDVGVEVQCGHDGDVVTQGLPDPPDDVGLCVLEALGHHRPVELQEDPVEIRLPESPLHLPDIVVEDLVGDGRGDAPEGNADGEHLYALGFADIDEASDGGVGPPPLLDDVSAPEFVSFEGFEARGSRPECDGFVAQARYPQLQYVLTVS